MVFSAVIVGLVVWASVAADVFALISGAGWWAIAAVAFPATVGVLAWRFGETYVG